MKLFNFTSNDYGPTWFVCASTRAGAIKRVRTAIHYAHEKRMSVVRKEYGGESSSLDTHAGYADHEREYNLKHLECCVAGKSSYPGGAKCSIEELEPGEVIFSEVS